jgi:hypothetical protein
MNNIGRQAFVCGVVDQIILLKLFGNIILVVKEKRIKLFVHKFWFLVKRYGIRNILGWKYISLADSRSDYHDFIIILNFFCEFAQV